MNELDLEAYLHAQIPASKALAISVKECCADRVTLTAPLEPNINHKNTVFGGSISVLGILSGWCLIYMRLQDFKNEIVIQESSLSYVGAANSAIEAKCDAQSTLGWDKLVRGCLSHGKGRITVESKILCGSDLVATFRGTYVAFNRG